ncbi:STOREKEEPER protein-like [Alnus glutinosa]|uniref:STOREKEEPER protein-like n=1 Tax=Alnus glutinosa TaxID=3517 RepID=UPI002D76AF3C|nr:STOREKEEPER protein-like [Alnus glutinosa]
MAPKRLKEDPPPATTSSGEEEESENDAVSEEEEEKNEISENEEEEKKEKSENEEEEDDEDEEEDEDEDLAKSPAGKPSVTPSKSQPSSGSDTESASGTDSDPKSPPSPSASAFTIKPIASKPMAHGLLKTTKANNNVPISVSGPSKRAAESDPSKAKDSKKRKVISSSSTTTITTATNGDDEDPKKVSGPGAGAIQRLWGEEDELAVLKGMIEYGSKIGSDPYSHMGVFHEFIKKSLRVEVSKAKLMDKIRRMKKKYQTNFDKGGNDMVFSKPHERKAFELSNKIWGTQTTRKPKINTSSVTVALPRQEVVENGGGVEGFWGVYPCLKAALETTAEMGFPGLSGLGTGTRFVREFMAKIGSGKLKEMEDRCREVRVAQLEVYVKRMELVHELGEVVLEAMKRR